jgi:hypothetical protein
MDWAASLWEFCIHRGLLGQRMIFRYKEKLPRGGFLRSMGGLKVVDRVFGVLIAPTKCLPVNARQTHRMLRHKKGSPNAKIPCFYGISVNIGESCAP